MTERLKPTLEAYGDWRQQTSRGSFLTDREEVIRTGTEAIVYIGKKGTVVLKEFFAKRTSHGYETAAQLIPDLIAPFEFLEDFPIQVDFRPHVIANGVAQARVKPLDTAFMQASQDKNVIQIIDIVKKHIAADREILERGALIPDPAYANYGDIAGNIVLIDPGGIKTTLNSIVEYMVHVNLRGKTHYSHYLALKAIGDKFGWRAEDRSLDDLYSQETGLQFDPRLGSIEQLHALLSRSKNIFDPLFWAVGQQEMEQYVPHQARYSREEQARLFEIAATASQ